MSTGFPLYPKRDFVPCAVDSCEVRFESPRSSYSHTSLLTNPHRDIDEEKSHHYEDPTVLNDQVRVIQGGGNTGHRKRFNDMYEPHIPLKDLRVGRSRDDSSCSELSDTYLRESCINRCILFFVLLTSVAALILVVLLMFGKVGPIVERNCACNNPEKVSLKAEAPNGQKVVGGQSNTGEVAEPVSPPDVSSLEDKINDLKANISMIKAIMTTLQHELHSTKKGLNETSNKVSETKNELLQIESGMQESIFKISNISQQLDKSVSDVNESFHIELASLETTFVTKLNSTAQSLSDADSTLKSSLDVINSSLTSQIQSISKLQGPTGPPGFNGSKGVPGALGNKGAKGNAGVQGSPGQQGVAGDPGRNGTDGVNGQQGDKGPQGDKGQQGAAGPAGPPGPQGPQGPPGAGNFSQCVYGHKEEKTTSGPSVTRKTILEEPVGKKILGVSCSTNQAAEYNLEVEKVSGKYFYRCICRGESSLVTPKENQMKCILHFWECPLTT